MEYEPPCKKSILEQSVLPDRENKDINSKIEYEPPCKKKTLERNVLADKERKKILIEAIKTQKVIWDVTDTKYNNKSAVNEAWEKIFEDMKNKISHDKCKRLWWKLTFQELIEIDISFANEILSFFPNKEEESSTKLDEYQHETKSKTISEIYNSLNKYYIKKEPTNEKVNEETSIIKEKKSNGTAVHGHAFQLKILILFLIRSKIYYPDFEISIEDSRFEKFDDIVLKIINGTKILYRLLQAKHKDEKYGSQKISLSEFLVSSNGPFSLYTYQSSFKKYKEELKKNIYDAIIFTNADLKLDSIYTFDNKRSIYLQKCLDLYETEDKIINFNQDLYTNLLNGKNPRLYKFNKEIINVLKDKKKICKNPEEFKTFEEDFKEFFEKLIIAVDQPNEEMLDEIIKIDLKEKLKITQNEIAYNELYKYVERWIISFCDKSVSKENFNAKIDSFERKLKEQELIGISKNYKLELENCGFNYVLNNIDISCIQNFLKSQMRVLHIMTDYTDLYSIKIHQILKNISTPNESFLSMEIESILNLQEHLIEAHQGLTNLLVIECKSTYNSDQTELFCAKLYKNLIFNKVNKKKVIFITQKHSKLISKILNDGSQVDRMDYSNTDFLNFNRKSLQNAFDQKCVKLYGKKIKLNLVFKFEDIEPHINVEILYQLISRKVIEIGNQLESLGEIEKFYVDRALIHSINICHYLSQEDSKFSIIRSIEDGDVLKNKQDLNKAQDLVIISDTNDIFEKTCDDFKESNELNIHWLKQDRGTFVWQKSKGSLNKLRAFLENGETKTFKSYNDIPDKVVILTGEPGMGKSTFLTKLANEIKEKERCSYILRINLLDYSEEINDLMKRNAEFDKNEVLNFLFNAFNKDECRFSNINSYITNYYNKEILSSKEDNEIRISNSIKKVLFKVIIEKGKFHLILDGFDEIASDNLSIVIKLIKICKSLITERLWISTRKYKILEKLEDGLSTFSYQFKPFKVEEQKKFLKSFWANTLNIENINSDRFITFYDALLKSVSLHHEKWSLNEKEKFLGIPLHISLIASVTQGSFKNFYNSRFEIISTDLKNELKAKLNLSSLYELFVTNKLKICFEEKRKINISIKTNARSFKKELEQLFQSHTVLAFFEIFEETNIRTFLSEKEFYKKEEYLEKLKMEEEEIGIVTVKCNQPRFIHRTFAEYFVARYFWQKFKSMPCSDLETFIEKYVYEIGEQILVFFQSIAQKDFKIEMEIAESHQKFEILLHLLLKNRFDERSNYLWPIVECALKNKFFKITYNTKNLSDVKLLELLSTFAEFGCTECIKYFIRKIPKEIVRNHLKTSEWILSPLWIAAKYNQSSIMKLLLENLCYDCNWFDSCYWTLSRTIYSLYDVDVLQSVLEFDLININKNCELYDIEKLILFRCIWDHAPSNLIKLLLKKTDTTAFNNCMTLTSDKYDVGNFIRCLLKYDKSIVKFAIDQGVDLSNSINILLYEYCSEYIYGFWLDLRNIVKQRKSPTSYEKTNFNLFDQIKVLLESGVKYNHLDTERNKTTLQYAELLQDISKLIDEVYKFCFEISNEYYSSNTVILKVILDCIKKNTNSFNNRDLRLFKIVLNEYQMYLQYDDKKIFLSSRRLATFLFVLKKGSMISHAKDIFIHFCDRLNGKHAISESGAKLLESLDGELHDVFSISDSPDVEIVNWHKFSEMFSDIISPDNVSTIPWILRNVINLMNITEKLEGAPGVKEISNYQRKMFEIDEVYDLLNIKNVKTNSKIFDLALKIYENNEIDVLFNISKRRLTAAYKMAIKNFVDQSSKFYEFLCQTHKLYDLNIECNTKENIETSIIHDQFYNEFISQTEVKNEFGETVLYDAIRKGNLRIVRYLTEIKNFNINVNNNKNETLIHCAAENGKLDILEYLFHNVENSTRRMLLFDIKTVFKYACKSGKLTIIKYLLNNFIFFHNYIDKKDENAEATLYYAFDNKAVLYYARESGKISVVKYLYKKMYFFDYYIDEKDENGEGTLHYASRAGALDILKYLIELNYYNYDELNNKNETILHCAIEEGKLEIVKYLTEMEYFESGIRASEGRSLLHYGIFSKHLNIIKYLVETTDINNSISDQYGKTPLDYAKENNDKEIINYLEEKFLNSSIDDSGLRTS